MSRRRGRWSTWRAPPVDPKSLESPEVAKQKFVVYFRVLYAVELPKTALEIHYELSQFYEYVILHIRVGNGWWESHFASTPFDRSLS